LIPGDGAGGDREWFRGDEFNAQTGFQLEGSEGLIGWKRRSGGSRNAQAKRNGNSGE
jgi:hypothetical protein